MVSERIFSCLPYIILYKTCDPGVGPFFDPSGINLNNIGRGPLGDTKYQISGLLAPWFQTRRFFHIFPTPGQGHFWPQVYNLNKLARGLLGDAKYQISIVYRPSGFRQEDFFTFSLYKSL